VVRGSSQSHGEIEHRLSLLNIVARDGRVNLEFDPFLRELFNA